MRILGKVGCLGVGGLGISRLLISANTDDLKDESTDTSVRDAEDIKDNQDIKDPQPLKGIQGPEGPTY